MLQIITEQTLPDNDFLCINDILLDMSNNYAGSNNLEWADRNHSAWQKRFETKHYKNVTIHDYDNTQPACYLVTLPNTIDRFNIAWVRCLKKETIEILKRNNVPILISQPLEHTYDYIDVTQNNLNRLSNNMLNLDNVLIQKGLQNNNIIIHGISNIHRQPHQLNNRKIASVFSTEFLSQGKYYFEEDRGTFKSLCKFEDHLCTDDKDKKFIFLNRVMRDIRCLTALKLTPYIEQGVFSFLGEEIAHQKLNNNDVKSRLELVCDVNNVPEEKDKISTFMRSFPYNIENDDHQNQRLNNIMNDLRKKVYYEIVAETHDMQVFDKDVSILSEKILWPILNNLPFLVIGHRKNHEFMRLLGFKTFEHLFFNPNDQRFTGTNVKEFLMGLEQGISHYNSANCTRENFLNLEQDIKHNFNHLVYTDWFEKEKEWLIANQSI